MKVTVKVSGPRWAWGDGDPPVILEAGEHELADAAPGLVAALGAAAAAGIGVEVVAADAKALNVLDKAVEPDDVAVELQAERQDAADESAHTAWEEWLAEEAARRHAGVGEAVDY